MAKMFYTLEEAAQRLGVGEEQIKEMANRGQLQQFRDRDKLMFKRDQVDGLAASASDDSAMDLVSPVTPEDSTVIPLDESGEITLADSQTGDNDRSRSANEQSDSIPLADETGEVTLADSGVASGELDLSAMENEETGEISLADTGEVDSGELLMDTGVSSQELSLEDTGIGDSADIDLADSNLDSGMDLTDTAAGISSGELDLGETTNEGTGELTLSDSGSDLGDTDSLGDSGMPLSGTGELDLNLGETGMETGLGMEGGGDDEDPRQATGISVFDADELDEPADPMAQTVVTDNVGDDELSLESVGSGSGLLDLTRESDDTSLGAELLDEIYPAGGEGSDAKLMETATGSSGVFDGAVTVDGEGSASGLENIATLPDATAGDTFDDQAPLAAAMPADTGSPMLAGASAAMVPAEATSPMFSGATSGMFMAVLASFVILGLILISTIIFNSEHPVMAWATTKDTNYFILVGALGGGVVILGGLGAVLGKMFGK